MLILVGDIGATNFRLRLARPNEKPLWEDICSSQDGNLVSIVGKFLQTASQNLGENLSPDKACFALAGPVSDNRCKMTNLPWPEIVGEELETALKIPKVKLINDFVAVGYHIIFDQDKDLVTLQEGQYSKNAPVAIIGAGSGLGVAFAVPTGGNYEVYASEGGHTNFAPNDPVKDDFLKFLRSSNSDNEAVLSGPGIVSIFNFLRDQKHISELPASFTPEGDFAETIAIEASKDNPDPLCKSTMELFVEAYGSFAGDIAVTFLPYGGIYIAGGIAAKNVKWMQDPRFLQSFTNKCRVNPALLEKVPIHVVMNTLSGLEGALKYACEKM